MGNWIDIVFWSQVYKIVKMIVDKNYDPCIVFTFDKKMIEEQAKALDRLDLNSDTEKSMIDAIFEASIDQLSPEDQNLPQVVALLPILKRGIGFHHHRHQKVFRLERVTRPPEPTL